MGADLSHRNYIKHLIDRYNEFAAQQDGRVFRHGAIYGRIKKRYGANWDLVPIVRFDDLAMFLQQQIDRTMRGSVNRRKGISNYSAFDQFCEKYRHAGSPQL